MIAPVLELIVDGDHVLMVYRGRGAGLAFEPEQDVFELRQIPAELLEHGRAIEARLPSQVDDAHTAPAELVARDVVADLSAAR